MSLVTLNPMFRPRYDTICDEVDMRSNDPLTTVFDNMDFVCDAAIVVFDERKPKNKEITQLCGTFDPPKVNRGGAESQKSAVIPSNMNNSFVAPEGKKEV